MNEICKIQLGDKGFLDVQEKVAVPLNWTLNDIKNISVRSGGYSKSILLADTVNNHRLMGMLFDVNISDSSFNKNIKEKCIILKNGIPQVNGFLQLTEIKKTSPSNPDGNYIVNYVVNVKEDIGNFYNDLNDTLLVNLIDYSQYDHVYEWSAITATSAHTWENVYKYHQFLSSSSVYGLKDFRPNLFSKAIWDYIFSAVGYTYDWQGDSFEDFKLLVEPYVGDLPVERPADNDAKRFKAGFSGSTQLLQLGIGSSTLIYDDDSTRDLYDSGGTYNNATGIYTANYYGSATFNVKFEYEIYLSAVTAITAHNNTPPLGGSPNSSPDGINYKLYNGMQTSGGGVAANSFKNFTIISGQSLIAGLNYITSGITPEYTYVPSINNQTNDSVWPNWTANTVAYLNTQNFGFGIHWENASGQTQTPPIVILAIRGSNSGSTNNYFKNNPTATQLGQGAMIYLNDYIDKKVKVKDWIKDIITIYNLYITYDQNKERHLLIRSRDDFYNEGTEIDITNRFDASREHTIQFLPDLQKKKILFTYKDGATDLNKVYKDATGEIYSQLEYTFENQFVKDTLTIGTTIFEPSPIDYNVFLNPVTAINGTAPKVGKRILYDCGWITGNTWQISYKNGISIVTETYSTYPFAGHFYPDPINPDRDLSFGLNDFLFYNNWTHLTNNNLFNRFYSRFINQIETGKLLTGWFKLDEFFINNLDFRNRLYIKDSWWFLNSIKDYDANSEVGLTLCEFISVDEGITFNPFKITSGKIKPNLAEYSNYNPLGFPENSNTFVNPFINTEAKGERNVVQAGTKSTLILGDGNNVNTEKSSVIGSGTTATGENIFSVGNDNFILADGVVVFGNNITADTTDTTYISNLTILSSITLSDNVLLPIVTGNLVTGTGTSNYVTKWNSSGSGITDSQIYDNGTNIGINNELPTAKLNIKATDNSTDKIFLAESSGDTDWLSIEYNGAININGGNGTNSTLSLHQRDYSFGSNIFDIYGFNQLKHYLLMSDNGSAGSISINGGDFQINTYTNNYAIGASPGVQKFLVKGSATGDIVSYHASGGSGGVYFAATSTNQPYIYMQDSAGTSTSLAIRSNSNSYFINPISIGIDSSTVPLKVRANASGDFVAFNPSGGSGGIYFASTSTNHPYIYLQNSGASTTLQFASNGNSFFSGGNVGFSTTSPTSLVDINGTNGYSQLRLRTNYTPSSSGDTNGSIGSFSWDNDFFYLKTNTGWGRIVFDYLF